MTWYRDAERELADVAAAVQSQRPPRMAGVETLAAALVSSLKQSDQLVVEALSGPGGSSLITNLINVGILGTRIGIGLGYYGKELERLAVAGLFHDIGLFAVPGSLITKAGRLTRDERALIEQHPELGYQVIHRIGSEYHWLAQVIRQAHERFNGQGYPKRLKGREISEMAQILGVVDVFDALVSERPYRKRLLPHEAVRELLVTERNTFPREILKALVEQLSVYPLGTTVKLTTGEVGTVVKVNSRYPLRPVVKVEDKNDGETAAPRVVDLSLTPLVSVIETLDPPAMSKLTFPGVPVMVETPPSPVVASDHFTSLLESLDAIASAIQGVVEMRMVSPNETQPDAGQVDGGPDGSIRGDLPFRNEVVGLFALEAREWLAHIQTALKKLGAGAEGPQRSKLYGFILNGITNLARSASTVQLSEIETMASELLPLLREVGSTEMESSAEPMRSLQAGLDRIATAVHRLAGEQPDVDVSQEQILDHESVQAESHGGPEESHQTPESVLATPERVASSMPLLKALRELQQARARTVQPARDMLEAVITRAAEEVAEGQDNISVDRVERILRDLDRLDDEFLREVNLRVPAMVGVLMRLRERGITDFVTASQFDPILTDVESLHDCAKTVHATTIMMFLQGLKSFLTETVYRKVESLPERLKAVEERLMALVPMAQQWVSLGRIERASIEDILPV
ncbi:MAG TPA: HD domain-containing phosphohydrolase [Nitrospira sp.]|nr:HD domain-containing phosphohydrolase [Nitrospira sp.]